MRLETRKYMYDIQHAGALRKEFTVRRLFFCERRYT